jgi:hypothetical protein
VDTPAATAAATAATDPFWNMIHWSCYPSRATLGLDSAQPGGFLEQQSATSTTSWRWAYQICQLLADTPAATAAATAATEPFWNMIHWSCYPSEATLGLDSVQPGGFLEQQSATSTIATVWCLLVSHMGEGAATTLLTVYSTCSSHAWVRELRPLCYLLASHSSTPPGVRWQCSPTC